MNERIKQLASESNLMEFIDGLEPIIYAHDIKRAEKFAKLIVLECAVIVGSMEESHQDIATTIKEHFGIE